MISIYFLQKFLLRNLKKNGKWRQYSKGRIQNENSIPGCLPAFKSKKPSALLQIIEKIDAQEGIKCIIV